MPKPKQRRGPKKRKPKLYKGVQFGNFLGLHVGHGFKFGDLCSISTLLRWLVFGGKIPRQILYVKDDTRTRPGGFLDYTWVFEESADIKPTDCVDSLRDKGLWTWKQWLVFRELVTSGSTYLPPKSKPPERYMAHSVETACKLGLPNRYAMLLPLYDAKYHQYRNGKVAWWHELLGKLAKRIPVLVTGPKSYGNDIKVPNGAFNGFGLDLPPMVTMAMISQCSLFVGGETGLPVWASVLGIPVAATWAYWHPVKLRGGQDYRPVPLSAPVVYVPLNGDVDQCAEIIVHMFEGER